MTKGLLHPSPKQSDIIHQEHPAEQQEMDSEILLAIINAAREAIIMIDDNGLIRLWSHSAEKLFGWTKSEAIVQNAQQLLSWESNCSTTSTNQPTDGNVKEMDVRDKEGRHFPIEVSRSEVQQNGQTLFVCTVQNTTERKEKEIALRESEQRHRKLFENSRDALMTLAPPSWQFTSCNPSTIKMFAAESAEKFLACPPWELSPTHQPDGKPSMEKAKEMIELAIKNGAHYFEWTHKKLTGEDFPATVLLTALEMDGEIMVQATVRDITARKQDEETRKIISRLDSLGVLVGGIAHDFNNLLTGIMGNASFALESFVNPEQQDVLNEIVQATKRATGLTKQLLTFAMGGTPSIKETAIGETIKESAQFCLGKNSPSTCLIKIPDDLWMVKADGSQIGQVIQNLVINATHAMPGGGEITI